MTAIWFSESPKAKKLPISSALLALNINDRHPVVGATDLNNLC
jgi:hypothetical protein